MAIRASDKKGFTLALPETGNQYFYVYTDIIKSQYHGDVVVPVLRSVTVKGEHGSYVPLNKKIFDTISIKIRDEAGDLFAFEHGKVIITLHFRRSKTQYFMHGRTIITYKPFRKSLPYKEVMFLFIVDQCCGLGSIFKSFARSVMPSLKEIGNSALTTGLEVSQDVTKGENTKQRQRNV